MSCDIPFSSQLVQKAEEYFEAARPFFGGREQEIEEGLAQCSDAQRICMKFLYGHHADQRASPTMTFPCF